MTPSSNPSITPSLSRNRVFRAFLLVLLTASSIAIITPAPNQTSAPPSTTIARPTTQTTTSNTVIPISLSNTVTFDHVTITFTANLSLDTTARTLTGTVSVTAVNATTGATIFSKTFTISLSFATSGVVKFILSIPSIPFTLATSCSFTTTSSGACTVSRTPDINHDESVDAPDLSVLLASFGASQTSPRYNPAADLNANGQVDAFDLSNLLSNYGVLVIQ